MSKPISTGDSISFHASRISIKAGGTDFPLTAVIVSILLITLHCTGEHYGQDYLNIEVNALETPSSIQKMGVYHCKLIVIN